MKKKAANKIDQVDILIYAIKHDIHFVAPFVLSHGSMIITNISNSELIASTTFKKSNYEKITINKDIKKVMVNIISDELNHSKMLTL